MSDREIMDAKQGIDRRSYAFRDPVVKHVVDKFVIVEGTHSHQGKIKK